MQREGFDRLYEDHAASLLAFLIYRTGDRELAEDVHADTFERVLRTGARFDSRRGAEKTWLYSIALNRLRDHYRRVAAEARALRRAAPDDAEPPEGEAFAERDAILTAMRGLSDDERVAVALRYGGDLSLREIAHVLGTRETTVKGRLHRALRKLHDELDYE